MVRPSGGLSADIKITGDKQIDRMFLRLPQDMQKKALRKATRKAAKVLKDRALVLVPEDTGELAKTIKVRARKKRSRRRERHIVGASVIVGEGFFRGDQYYSGFVEFGLQTRDYQADPFLRPAMADVEPEVRRTFADDVKTYIRSLGRVRP